jgi:hypothetical protein
MPSNSNPAVRLAPITAGASDLNPIPRAIRVEGTGSFTYVNHGSDTTERTLNVTGVETFPFSPKKITAVSSVTVSGYYDAQ